VKLTPARKRDEKGHFFLPFLFDESRGRDADDDEESF